MKRSTQKLMKKRSGRKRKTRLQKRVQKGGTMNASKYAEEFVDILEQGRVSWLSLTPTSDIGAAKMYLGKLNYSATTNGQGDRIKSERRLLENQINTLKKYNCTENMCKECSDIHSFLMKKWKEIRKVIFLFEKDRELMIMVKEGEGKVERKVVIRQESIFSGEFTSLKELANEMHKVLNMYYRQMSPSTSTCKEVPAKDLKVRTNKYYFDKYWGLLQTHLSNGTCNCQSPGCVEAVHQLKGLYNELAPSELREHGPKDYKKRMTEFVHMEECGISSAPNLSSESTVQKAVNAFQGM